MEGLCPYKRLNVITPRQGEMNADNPFKINYQSIGRYAITNLPFLSEVHSSCFEPILKWKIFQLKCWVSYFGHSADILPAIRATSAQEKVRQDTGGVPSSNTSLCPRS